ncbi:MAG: hypothetical protein RMK30_02435 [Anaerolineae bacterium]|nr:hypothetical protein [Anaerolineae bacterium]MDW8101719.1 hypothetical protein [Anaerolineae bacterium]
MVRSKWLLVLFMEAMFLLFVLLFLLPISSFSFALKVKEDSTEDFADGSFRFTALTPEGGVRLLPLWQGGRWVTDTQSLPIALSSLSAVAWQGKIFVVGGDDSNGCRRREVYSTTINPDGSLQPWVTLPQDSWLPKQNKGRYECGGVGHDGLSSGALVLHPHSELTATLYYIGGIRDDNSISSKVYTATVNGATGEISRWVETTPLEEEYGRYYHSAIAVEGFIFVIGGNLGTGAGNAKPTDEVCKARINPDGSLSEWFCEPSEKLPWPLRNFAAVYYTGELSRTIYVIGGENLDGSRSEVLFADVITSSTPPTPTLTGWYTSAGGGLPQPLSSHGVAEARGEIFLTGGEVGLGQQVSNTVQLALVDENSPDTRLYDWGSGIGAWVGGPILPQERSLHATAIWRSYIYVIGGDGPETPPQRKNTIYRGNIDEAGAGEPYYAPRGFYFSSIISFEPGKPVTVTQIRYSASVPQDTGLRFRERHQTESGWSGWSSWSSFITGTNSINLNLSGVLKLQYQLELTRGQAITVTPSLDWIEFYYEVPDPQLGITKTSYLGIASPGDILDYILIFSNTGGVDLPQTVITEELPPDTSFVGWGWSPAGGNYYTRTVRAESYGKLGIARFRIRIREGITSEYITNTAWIAHPPVTDALGRVYTFAPVSATYTLQITGIRALHKSAYPEPGSIVYWGQPVTYTIAFSNLYRTTFSTLNITDPVNLSYLFNVVPFGGGVLKDGVISWTLSNVTPGETKWLSFTARITPGLPAGTLITDVAYSQAFVSDEVEPVLSQLSNEVSYRVKGTTLSLSKSSTPPPGSRVRWYDLITYSIAVTNTGYYTFTIALTDTLDTSALDFLTAPGGVHSGGTVTWTVGPLGPGSSGVVTLTARVKCGLQEGYEIANVARATAAQSDVFSSNSITHPVAGPPVLIITKEASPPSGSSIPPNSTITYTIRYTNTGQSPAGNVVITDPIDLRLEYIGGGTKDGDVISWSVGTLKPGVSGSVTFTARVKGDASGTITNYAYIRAECLETLRSNPVTHTVTAPTPYLVLSKASLPGAGNTVQAGDLITYSIRITNTGAAQALSVVVTDPLDVKLEFVGGSPPPSLSGGVLRWELGNLGVGASVGLTFTAKVITCTTGTISNVAYATGQGLGLASSGLITHAIAGCPALSVSKGSVPPSGSFVFPGDLITYTLYFTNSGGIARNTVVTDLLPAKVILVNSGGASVSDRVLSWTGLVVGQGASGQRSFVVQVDPSITRCQVHTITNEFYGIEARESYGTFPGLRGMKVEHPVEFVPDLAVSVSDGKSLVSRGESLTYTIAYTNVCGIQVGSAVLGITLSNGLIAGSNPGWSGSGNYFTRTVGPIPGGRGSAFSFSASVASSPPESVGVTVTIYTSQPEWDPWNNVASDWNVTGGVDLVVEKLEVSPSAVPLTGTMRVTVTVLNQGDRSINQSGYVGLALYLKAYPSSPPARSGDWDGLLQACPDKYQGYCFEWLSKLDLGPGTSKTVYFDVRPGFAVDRPGAYDLYAYVDVGDKSWDCHDSNGCVSESCEVNNWAGRRNLQITGEAMRKIFLPLVLRNWGGR